MTNFKINCRASICINDNIYIDPFKLKESPQNAKVILITHSHWDHLSIEDIKKVVNENTHFIAPQDCIDKLKEAGFELENQTNYWAVGGKSFDKMYHDDKDLGYEIPNTNIRVLAFPSYNIDKQFHPKENAWVGYILTIDDVRYVIPGDSDVTPELEKIKCDVLFVPIGGRYTMNATEAAELTNKIKPKLVVPTHYMFKARDNGEIMGDKNTERMFVEKLDKGIEYKVVLNNMEE